MFAAKCTYYGSSFAGFAWNALRDFVYDGMFELGCVLVLVVL